MAIAMEAMAAQGCGSALVMLTMMDALCILRAGPDEARERYLPAIARGDMKMAFAITEPDAGSNSFKMRMPGPSAAAPPRPARPESSTPTSSAASFAPR